MDLTYCNLDGEEPIVIAKAMKRSRSLIAVHFSGNMLDSASKERIRGILKPREKLNDMDLGKTFYIPPEPLVKGDTMRKQ